MRFLGTTWEKIEGRFLLSTSGSGGSGQVGGSNTKTITQANLPNIKLQVDTFSLTVAPHIHNIAVGGSRINWDSNYDALQNKVGTPHKWTGGNSTAYSTASTESSSGSTGTASPYTSALGSGTPLDITPAYYTVHIWKRLT